MSQIVYAKAKYVRSTARKTRLVMAAIRRKNALATSELLKFTTKRAAQIIKKVLDSAVANAVNNFGLAKKDLVIVEAYVNEAPTFKRGRAVSRGRYHQILKRNAHIVIGVSTDPKAMSAVAKKETKQEKAEQKKMTAKTKEVAKPAVKTTKTAKKAKTAKKTKQVKKASKSVKK